jgi:CRP/FNR family cyclic AMP-dependent transcriptional regulator
MPLPTPSDKRRVFEGHALFGKLPQADLDALLRHARVQHYALGQEIFAKGTPGRSVMAILRGCVRISTPSPAGPDIVLAILQPGEVFGEIALLDGENRTADAIAIEDCDLLVLDQRDFLPFLERRADICILLLRLLCQRLRQTDQHVGEAMFGRLDGRIAMTLIRLAGNAPVGPKGVVMLRLTQQDLAGMVGAARESVNKQLHVWQDAGILRLGKRLIEIADLAALDALT